MEKRKKTMRRAVILALWLVLWQLASAVIRNRIIFVGPMEAASALAASIGTAEFWRTVLCSTARIAGGFAGAFLAGIGAASLAGRFPLLGEFLEPPVALLQSVPVASFVILALIWIGSKNLSVLVTFLVVFPVIYRNVLAGISETDSRMLEMARVFRMGAWKKAWYLYRPALMPYLLAGCRISLGMAWKSGVAAEVIGVPDHSIGEKLYMAKIYLSTAELFAWTFVVIAASRAFEWLFLYFLGLLAPGERKTGQKKEREKRTGPGGEKMGQRRPDRTGGPSAAGFPGKMSGVPFAAGLSGRVPGVLTAEHLCKAYHGQMVLHDESLALKAGRTYCLMGSSGQGKTTLLRLLMGLEKPDAGSVSGFSGRKISAVFQEDRLCGYLDAASNIRIAAGREGLCRNPEWLLGQLLEPEAIHRPVQELSGGMKRRAAVARALACSSELVLMDEPFTGLDEKTREQTIRVIKENLDGRTLLLVTHQAEDAVRLGAEILRLRG